MSLILDEHRQYLADAPRIDAFASALRAVVAPGDVVLDLASGTGILGLLACQAGAARVYALEMDSIIEVARQLARENGFGDRVVCIQDVSQRATLPEQVDVVVTDGAGRFGFEAGLLETLGDARRRFLKPQGRTIPSSLSLWIAPVEASEPWQHVDFWTRPLHGLSFDAAHAIARATGYPRHLHPDELIAKATCLCTLDPSMPPDSLSGEADVIVTRPATLYGIGGWFSAGLAPGIELTNAPGAANRINRRNVFFPAGEPVAVKPGDRVCLSMRIRPAARVVWWRIEVYEGETGARRHASESSTFDGMLISREEIARTEPRFQPELTPAGRARKTVLDLCDGARTVAAIEEEVFRRHAELFADHDAAAAFVAEVVTRYTT